LLYVFFKDDPAKKGPGLLEADLQPLFTLMKLVQRADGTERGRKPSSWLKLSKG
jgi:hypothetical protein